MYSKDITIYMVQCMGTALQYNQYNTYATLGLSSCSSCPVRDNGRWDYSVGFGHWLLSSPLSISSSCIV